MKRRDFLKGAAAAGTGAATLSRVPVASAQTTVDGVSQDLRCYCGCGDLLSMCDCEDAVRGRTFVQDKIDQGMSRDEIIDAYVNQFSGPMNSEYNLRATVSKSGRGLSLWLLPPVVIVVGGAALYYFIKRGTGETATAGTGSAGATVTCGDCGSEVPADSKFCRSCGAEVTAVSGANYCPGCGTEATGDEAFCTNCGEEL